MEERETSTNEKPDQENELDGDLALDEEGLEEDPVLQAYREKRLQEFKKQMSDLEKHKTHDHGVYSEITVEKDFLKITTETPKVVCHFFHKDFTRCKIVDKHLSVLAQKYVKTKFVKIDVEHAPFFVEKLQVRMLPCVIMFIDGRAIDRIVGFSDLGDRDDFSTALFEKRLANSDVIIMKTKGVKREGKRSISESKHNEMNSDDEED